MPRGCTCDGTPNTYCPRCQAILDRAEGQGSRGDLSPMLQAPRSPQEPPGARTSLATKKASGSIGVAGRRHKPPKTDRYRSNTERRYAALLDTWLWEEDIARWWYEPMKLWLAPKTTITIDFLVRRYGGERLELHEVKGGWYREDGLVKLKIAAHMYPCYKVVMAQWQKGEWIFKEIPCQ